jgi:hypothetical protein
MEGTIDLRWRKSSYSGNGGGNCVGVAGHGSRVLVRDTKDRVGPILRFSPETWRRFAEQVKRSLARAQPGSRDRLPRTLQCLGGSFGFSGPTRMPFGR